MDRQLQDMVAEEERLGSRLRVAPVLAVPELHRADAPAPEGTRSRRLFGDQQRKEERADSFPEREVQEGGPTGETIAQQGPVAPTDAAYLVVVEPLQKRLGERRRREVRAGEIESAVADRLPADPRQAEPA